MVDNTATVQARMPLAKRVLDLVGAVALLPIWGSALLVVAGLNLLANGRPAFYVSSRRVYGGESARVIKFRTMIRNADKIANRETVPVTDQRFLNIGPESPLYTPLGRTIERLFLTEIPQFLHVLSGRMSLIGNRPLPEDVITMLKQAYPDAELRFATRCGLSGPVQLVGREEIDDGDRLRLEIGYARCCVEAYSLRLDIMLGIYTALILLRLKAPMTVDEVAECIEAWTGTRLGGRWPRVKPARQITPACLVEHPAIPETEGARGETAL